MGSSERWVLFRWSCRAGLGVCGLGAGGGGLLLGFSVVVPVAECADHVDGGVFPWLPLTEVGCFEVRGFGAALPVLHHGGAAVSVAVEGLLSDASGDVVGAVVLPCHQVPPGVLRSAGRSSAGSALTCKPFRNIRSGRAADHLLAVP